MNLVIAVIGLLAGLVWLGLLSFLVAAITGNLIRGSRRRLAGMLGRPEPAGGGWPSFLACWAVSLLGLCLMIFLYASRARQVQASKPGPVWIPLFMLALGLFIVGRFFWPALKVMMRGQYFDRDVSRTVKRANAGDVDGAIEELDEVIRLRGPTAHRLNALGALMSLRGRWPEAYRLYREADELGGLGDLPKGHQAIALWKMGRAEEAADLLEKLCAQEPDNFTWACHACLVLADLDRFDRARDHFRRAEALLNDVWYSPSALRAQCVNQLDECRKRLGPVPGDEGLLA